jgi:protein tyrosine phosphatase (PTP) superfamily phosphohydrolase (DUF442 family)
MGVTLSRSLRTALLAPYLALFYPYLALRRAAAKVRSGQSWRTWVTSDILLGGFLAPGDVDELSALGIRAVVNVSRELVDPSAALRAAGIDYLRVPCWDTRAPSLGDAERGVRFMEDTIAGGKSVYVHCASGVGRSVALTVCYLATRGGLDPVAAVDAIQRRRPRIAMSTSQRRFVADFIAAYGARSME